MIEVKDRLWLCTVRSGAGKGRIALSCTGLHLSNRTGAGDELGVQLLDMFQINGEQVEAVIQFEDHFGLSYRGRGSDWRSRTDGHLEAFRGWKTDGHSVAGRR